MKKVHDKPYLLFDAGGTLIFPDFHLLADLIVASCPGRNRPTVESLHDFFLRATHELDRLLGRRLQGEGAQRPGTDHFIYRQMLSHTQVPEEKVDEVLAELDRLERERNLWSLTYPWVAETLQTLRAEGFRMSVISNSDGRVAQVLAAAGLGQFFEMVIDSYLEGYEKPDPKLFRLALVKLGLHPQECLYIGDFYHIDVLGANRAGIAGVQLDFAGLAGQAGWPGRRLPSVASLPGLLAYPGFSLADPDLHPFAGNASPSAANA